MTAPTDPVLQPTLLSLPLLQLLPDGAVARTTIIIIPWPMLVLALSLSAGQGGLGEFDSKDHPEGVWTLPPSLRLGPQDYDKYVAIGESDRMTVKFGKPRG